MTQLDVEQKKFNRLVIKLLHKHAIYKKFCQIVFSNFQMNLDEYLLKGDRRYIFARFAHSSRLHIPLEKWNVAEAKYKIFLEKYLRKNQPA